MRACSYYFDVLNKHRFYLSFQNSTHFSLYNGILNLLMFPPRGAGVGVGWGPGWAAGGALAGFRPSELDNFEILGSNFPTHVTQFCV